MIDLTPYNGDEKSAKLLINSDYVSGLVEAQNFVELICLLRSVGMNDLPLNRLVSLTFQLEPYRGQISNWNDFVLKAYEFVSLTVDTITAHRYFRDLVDHQGNIIP